MADVTITITSNGPYIVKGPIELRDASGNVLASEKPVIALCRCGASTTKPYCDGTHSTIGFLGAEQAAKEAG